MTALWHDIRQGFRQIKRKPGFALSVIVCLGLGIGGVTAVLSVMNGVFVKHLPYHDVDNLVVFACQLPMFDLDITSVSSNDYREWKSQNRSFSGMAAYQWHSSHSAYSGWSDTQENMKDLDGLRIEPGFFSVLGIEPLLGRTLTPDETCFEEIPLILLSHHIWRDRFDGNENVIGQSVKLEGRQCTVAGVMPPGLRFLPSTIASINGDFSPNRNIDYWIPLGKEFRENKESYEYDAVARLTSGISLSQAQSDMDAIAFNLHKKYPDSFAAENQISFKVTPLAHFVLGNVRPVSWLALLAAGFVLLIACANVANLTIVRCLERKQEMRIRSCMGAGSIRLVRLMLVEQLILVLPAGILGIFLSLWTVDFLVRIAPANLPGLDRAGVDGWVLAAALIVTIGAGVLIGLFSSLWIGRPSMDSDLNSSGNRTTGGKRVQKTLGWLVSSEIALTLILLLGTGLTLRSFWRVMQESVGIVTDNILAVRVSGPRLPDEFDSVLRKLENLPGVLGAASTTTMPMSGQYSDFVRLTSTDSAETHSTSQPLIWSRTVSGNYFSVMGIRLKKGRLFGPGDREESKPVIVVNDTLSKKLWPDKDCIGKHVQVNVEGTTMGIGDEINPLCEIVGVVEDVKYLGPDKPAEMEIYMPYRQRVRKHIAVTFVLRSSGDPKLLSQTAEREIKSAGPSLAVGEIRTMSDFYSDTTARRILLIVLLSFFAAIALVLAVLGIYGVTAYSISLRTQEIGIRAALGAQRKHIVGMLLRHAAGAVATGVVFGVFLSLFLQRIIASQLYGISVYDPATLAVGVFVVTAVPLMACYLPARRASMTDPMEALRWE